MSPQSFPFPAPEAHGRHCRRDSLTARHIEPDYGETVDLLMPRALQLLAEHVRVELFVSSRVNDERRRLDRSPSAACRAPQRLPSRCRAPSRPEGPAAESTIPHGQSLPTCHPVAIGAHQLIRR